MQLSECNIIEVIIIPISQWFDGQDKGARSSNFMRAVVNGFFCLQ